jgi:small basic protein
LNERVKNLDATSDDKDWLNSPQKTTSTKAPQVFIVSLLTTATVSYWLIVLGQDLSHDNRMLAILTALGITYVSNSL